MTQPYATLTHDQYARLTAAVADLREAIDQADHREGDWLAAIDDSTVFVGNLEGVLAEVDPANLP